MSSTWCSPRSPPYLRRAASYSWAVCSELTSGDAVTSCINILATSSSCWPATCGGASGSANRASTLPAAGGDTIGSARRSSTEPSDPSPVSVSGSGSSHGDGSAATSGSARRSSIEPSATTYSPALAAAASSCSVEYRAPEPPGSPDTHFEPSRRMFLSPANFFPASDRSL